MIKEIIIREPFDAHVHLRDGEMLKGVISSTAAVFPRAVVMGNLPEPIDDATRVRAYREEIRAAAPDFNPIMTVMLTRKTNARNLEESCKAGAKVLKFIPGAASTNGAQGLDLPDLLKLLPILRATRDLGMIFSCHFELAFSNGLAVPMLDQECQAIRYAYKIIQAIPDLRMVVEHASTAEIIEFVKSASVNVAATLTPHHAILTYEDVCYETGRIINPFNFCKPIAKVEEDRRAVIEAMTGGSYKFFFGSDSAPHPMEKKQGPNPPAGIFSAPVALSLLCEIFERQDAPGRLEEFVSLRGPHFYGLKFSERKITLSREPWEAPEIINGVKVFQGGKTLQWKVK